MYKEYTARPWARLFLVLHPNIALSPERRHLAHNFVSTPFSARYVRLSTRLAEKGVLSRSASKWRRSANKFRAGVLEPDVSHSETEPEPQGGDYLSAEP